MDGLNTNKKKLILNLFVIFVFLLFILFQNQIHSQELQREYRSARFLGRGDTGIANANGGDAVFYNPAGISQGKGILNEIMVASPQGEGTENIQDLYNSSQGNKSAIEILSQNQNKVFSGAIQNFTGLVFRKVSLGVLERANANAYAGIDPTTGIPTANIYGANRTGAYLTLAHDFFDQRFLIGMNAKFLQKSEADLKITALNAESQISNNSLKTIINNSIKRGNGIGADLGLMLILHKESSTQIGIVYRNIGMQYRWTIPEGSSPPSSEPTVIDTGFTTSFGTKKSKVAIYADMRDITNIQKVEFAKRIHLGAEYSLMNYFGVMTGLNQGYGTFGIFFSTKIIKIEGGMYTEEIGDRLGSLPSQRYYGRIVLGWLI